MLSLWIISGGLSLALPQLMAVALLQLLVVVLPQQLSVLLLQLLDEVLLGSGGLKGIPIGGSWLNWPVI